MSTQLNLLSLAKTKEEKEELKKVLKYPAKRIRYIVPNYLNFHTLYQYDRDKFRELMRDWLKTDEGKNRTLETLQAKQDEILEQSFLKDENGNKFRDSDEKHIYRYQTLHKIMSEIYNIVHWEFIKTGTIFNIDGLTISQEEEMAEIQGTEMGVSIKERILQHIGLLRLLRKGLSVRESMKIIKKGNKSP